MEENRLPFKTISLAADLFAGDAGLTHNEMDDFFCRAMNKHPDEVGILPAGNRRGRFKGWLDMLTASEQKAILLELCRKGSGYLFHGAPPKEDRDRLAGMLTGLAVEEAVGDVLARLDSSAVSEMWRKALQRCVDDPGGAITAARTLVETVCRHVLDQLGEESDYKGDLQRLYKATAKCLELAPDQHADEGVKQILRGCAAAVNGLAPLSNAYGDRHAGVGKPAPRHAELAVNLAGTMASLLVATWEARKEPTG